ncbi:LLM class F420-dependent oxidoreductase [Actinomadura rudentiformis]|uniref:LLM class F420-dependent oxidoreductase n=1 Tax=Actinomadura rudentiformis TaxID=359158 RepID=A0A6H9ZBM6_9ACTN|nr:LLM class F420-dependent oxidoreductase [Actinomadura rudentiformis]KAB2351722.1 LLM class F420-dependent oxidoreductase [Actinomadura rudentiformis]
MTIGVALPPATSGNAIDTAVARAREASEAGLRSIWSGQRLDADAIALAGFIGREVPDVTVGTSAVPIFARHPILVASQAHTSQAATGGRFQLGLGLGAGAFVEPVFGVPYDRPIARLREFLTVLRSLTEDGSADFQGETLTASTPMPAAVAGAPPVPLLVAAMGPQALRATGELADGTLPFLAGPRTLGEHIVPQITTAAERAGRPAPRIVAFVAGIVTSDVDAAREAAAQATGFYDRLPSYQRVVALEGASRAAELVVTGDEETVAAEVRRYFDAGATEVVFTQTDLTTDEDRERTWKLLGGLAADAQPG